MFLLLEGAGNEAFVLHWSVLVIASHHVGNVVY